MFKLSINKSYQVISMLKFYFFSNTFFFPNSSKLDIFTKASRTSILNTYTQDKIWNQYLNPIIFIFAADSS